MTSTGALAAPGLSGRAEALAAATTRIPLALLRRSRCDGLLVIGLARRERGFLDLVRDVPWVPDVVGDVLLDGRLPLRVLLQDGGNCERVDVGRLLLHRLELADGLVLNALTAAIHFLIRCRQAAWAVHHLVRSQQARQESG
eukprot:scaffold22292_cov121-Isochrysis_galbana.AAC.3